MAGTVSSKKRAKAVRAQSKTIGSACSTKSDTVATTPLEFLSNKDLAHRLDKSNMALLRAMARAYAMRALAVGMRSWSRAELRSTLNHLLYRLDDKAVWQLI